MFGEFIDAEVWPEGSLEVLSQFEADQLQSSGSGGLYPLLRRCMLAVLNSDSNTDDARALLRTYRDFEVGFIRQDRGLKVSLRAADEGRVGALALAREKALDGGLGVARDGHGRERHDVRARSARCARARGGGRATLDQG